MENQTNAAISYQVIGATDRQSLLDGDPTKLLNLDLPTTLTVVRKDKGLIDVKVKASQAGSLEVILNIRVQEEGQVLIC